ncbi:peptidoglycan-binding domain-containing protein [Schaalia sp. lx-260]|uniref:peptidoglycan-binding domain-containing protein n=1 Tax=Schaalia sp. lx-260 TaxID=2899082 RepID=UPI001E2CA922|nr:hypothetical protein [Schaalia sp. lx-260]MCD4550267.1 hypothetical protein [Schaalia sp. lx-260]
MKWNRIAYGATLVLVILGIGLALGAYLFQPVTPHGTEKAAPLTSTPVSSRTIDDKRTVSLSVTYTEEEKLFSPTTGLLTRMNCSPRAPISSGNHIMTLEDRNIYALATSIPLWRDLSYGDKGDDVQALNEELQRLGYTITTTDTITADTFRAIAHMMGLLSSYNTYNLPVISPSSFIWLPHSSITPAECTAKIGQNIEVGTPLITLEKTLTEVRISDMPQNLLEGEHNLTIDTLTLPINADGSVTDPDALAQLVNTPTYRAWKEQITDENSNQKISAQLALVEPTLLYSLSPAAIYAIEGQEGCVLDGTQVRPVRIISSELGQTFITFTDNKPAPDTLNLPTGSETPCRSH